MNGDIKVENFLELIFSLSGFKDGVWIEDKHTKMRLIAKAENNSYCVYQVVGKHKEGLLYQGSDEERVKEIFRSRC